MPQEAPLFPWVGKADHATRDPTACIADRLTAVIRFGVNDEPAAHNRILWPGGCRALPKGPHPKIQAELRDRIEITSAGEFDTG